MTAPLIQNPAGLHVARPYELPHRSADSDLNHRIIRTAAPHFSPTDRITLQVLDRFGRGQYKPIVLCEWLTIAGIKLALCRNPYPTESGDQWLLCRPDGVVCFTAASPEFARIQLYFLTGSLRTA
jgi:hypothetical protein